jgi:dihydrolipoamide dehydrogenase
VIDVPTMIGRKDKIVKQLTGGIGMLFKANKVMSIAGRGKLLAGKRVEVTAHDGSVSTLSANHVILAAGSVPIQIPSMPFDGKYIVDNVGALDFDTVPKRFGVIGAGVIGLEMGSVWKRLGAEVTILEALPDFLAACDADIARVAAREYKKQGLDIKLGCKVNAAEVRARKCISATPMPAARRSPWWSTACWSRSAAARTRAGCWRTTRGVTLNARGQIEVDEHNRTAADDVWAIGDCVRGPMLAHKGSEEGIAVAELIAGKAGHVNLDTVPWVIYTEPEIAWVGKTEKECKDAGIPVKTGSFPFAAVGRAMAMNETYGQVKIIAHAETDRVLGVHMIGPMVSELIAECVVAMEFQASQRGPRAHLPRPPDAVRGRARGRAGGRQARDPSRQLSASSATPTVPGFRPRCARGPGSAARHSGS